MGMDAIHNTHTTKNTHRLYCSSNQQNVIGNTGKQPFQVLQNEGFIWDFFSNSFDLSKWRIRNFFGIIKIQIS